VRVRVKLCGVRRPEAIRAAVAQGVDAVGFLFARSPRQVDPARARALAAGLPPAILRVAVLHRPPPAELQAVLDAFDPDVVQVELAPELLSLAGRCRALWAVLHDDARLAEQVGLARATRAGTVVFEAAGRGGRGIAPDFERAATLAREFRLVLAGGLDSRNVARAIGRVAPFAVDVSSGVESAPGVKDPRAIAAFVAAVRDAERGRQPAEQR